MNKISEETKNNPITRYLMVAKIIHTMATFLPDSILQDADILRPMMQVFPFTVKSIAERLIVSTGSVNQAIHHTLIHGLEAAYLYLVNAYSLPRDVIVQNFESVCYFDSIEFDSKRLAHDRTIGINQYLRSPDGTCSYEGLAKWMIVQFALTREETLDYFKSLLDEYRLEFARWVYDRCGHGFGPVMKEFIEALTYIDLYHAKMIVAVFPITLTELRKKRGTDGWILSIVAKAGTLDMVKWTMGYFQMGKSDIIEGGEALMNAIKHHPSLAAWMIHAFSISPRVIPVEWSKGSEESEAREDTR